VALSKKQQEFIDAYLGEAKFNASEAARIAGYPERSAASVGHENLRKPEIAAEIERRVSDHAMGRHELLIELGDQARFDLGKYVEGTYVNLQRIIEDGQGRFIKKIVPTQWGHKIEFHDPFAAKRLIADLLEKARGTEEDPLLQVTMSLAEWRAEREKRRQQADAIMAEFDDDDESADE
jgi:hypothetical protein